MSALRGPVRSQNIGKTTLAISMAVDLARRDHAVCLSTTVSSVHLMETLHGTHTANAAPSYK